ncbi:MAG: tetratricopeptide repeat protein [Candidatus Methanoperedens sp.]|nr:tetratricopeptide repeat protein [Candidatus Methanoperedens sp.]
MTGTDSLPGLKNLILHLGYHETATQDIIAELDVLFDEIAFDKTKQAVDAAIQQKDTESLKKSLKDLVTSLEGRGFYRPDYPAPLIVLLVNGLNLREEDIFSVIGKSNLTRDEKLEEMELLASCAAITQLGYILLSCLMPDVKAANAGPHVFLLIDSFSKDSFVFVDFSIDSIIEVPAGIFSGDGENYSLIEDVELPDGETSQLVKEYYSFFQVTRNNGLTHNIHNNIGNTYERVGEFGKAIEELTQAIRLNPGYIEAHNNLAVARFKNGEPDKAIKLLQKAIKLYPRYAEARSNLGNIFLSMQRYDDAISEMEEALRLKPGFAGGYNNLGNIYAELERTDEAIEKFTEAIRLDPDYALAHNNLGNMFAASGKYEMAITEFEEAVRTAPGLTEAYHGLACVYYELGSVDKAVHAWARAVILEPGLMDSVPDSLMLKVSKGVSRMKRGV